MRRWSRSRFRPTEKTQQLERNPNFWSRPIGCFGQNPRDPNRAAHLPERNGFLRFSTPSQGMGKWFGTARGHARRYNHSCLPTVNWILKMTQIIIWLLQNIMPEREPFRSTRWEAPVSRTWWWQWEWVLPLAWRLCWSLFNCICTCTRRENKSDHN